VVAFPFDIEHIDLTMNERTREKSEDGREEVILSFHGLREGGDAKHGVDVGGERVTQCSDVPTGRGSGEVVLPVAAAPLLDRTRDGDGAVAVVVSLVVRAPAPTSSYCAARRGPTSRVIGLSVLDQDVVKGSVLTVRSRWMRSILTFSPLISSYTLNFKLNIILISFTIPSQISA
jgi:hypothetical protein